MYFIQKDGQNIGYLTIHQANVITLQSLYIVSEYQRQGVGRAAFEHVKAFCRECDAASFICYCVPENVNARAFYERMGGTLIECRPDESTEAWQNSVTYSIYIGVNTKGTEPPSRFCAFHVIFAL